MAYCTIEDLAFELRIPVNEQNRPKLERCIEAAALEIDDHACRFSDTPILAGDPLAQSINVGRAGEWWKTNDAAVSGAVGMDQSGILTAPRSSFTSRWGSTLTPLKQRFGVA